MKNSSFDAKQIVEDLLSGKDFSEKEIKSLNAFPIMDELREQVVLMNQAETLLNLLKQEKVNFRTILWINLIQPLILIDERFVDALRMKYLDTTLDPLVKIEIVFRLLDYEQNDIIIENYIDFFVGHWIEINYSKVYPNWSGGYDIFEVVNKRLNDNNINNKKKWVYVFLSLEENNPSESRKLLNNGNIMLSETNRAKLEQYLETLI